MRLDWRASRRSQLYSFESAQLTIWDQRRHPNAPHSACAVEPTDIFHQSETRSHSVAPRDHLLLKQSARPKLHEELFIVLRVVSRTQVGFRNAYTSSSSTCSVVKKRTALLSERAPTALVRPRTYRSAARNLCNEA